MHMHMRARFNYASHALHNQQSVKAKFHYASWFEADSVMEFGFKLTRYDNDILI